MEEYVKLFDECMYNMHSEEADLLESVAEEANMIADLLLEHMWYKHEDYMLWKALNRY